MGSPIDKPPQRSISMINPPALEVQVHGHPAAICKAQLQDLYLGPHQDQGAELFVVLAGW